MYRFYSKPDGNARVTVLGAYDETNHTFSIAASRCSEKDAFVKSKGVKIAQSRLDNGALYSQIRMNEAPNSRLFKLIAMGVTSDILSNSENVVFRRRAEQLA